MRRTVAALLLLLLLSIAACTDGAFDSPAEIAAELRDSPVGCERFRELPAPYDNDGECESRSGVRLGLSVYRDEEQASTMVASGVLTLADSDVEALVHAGRWIVYVDDEATADAVQEALGGDVTAVGSSGG